MNFKRLLLFLAAPLALALNSCETAEPEYTLPMIKVTDASGTEVTAVNFGAEGGEQCFTITATRSWNITSQADWFAITPINHNNADMKSVAVEVTLTAAPNEGAARNETIKIAMDKSEVSITVAQAGAGQVALGDVIFYDNFDKGGQAQKGSNGWDTYMDGAGAAYCNPTPENQANVSYAGTKLTVRSNSSNGSGGQHSNYEGSGVNYLWFGTAPTNFTVSGISLAELEGNALTLSFGTERYEYNAADNTFKNDEFHVYISGDGQKWTEVEYSFLEGVNLNGKWNIATSQFNLKEVPETLSIYFTTSVSSAYAIDDLKLTAGGGGAEIDLSQGGAISGGGNTGGGDNTGAPESLIEATIAEFLAAPVSSDTWYKLTGEIVSIAKEDYGNFTIKDATDEVYIYGMTNGWVGKNDKSFSQIGLKVGDTVTLGTLRGEYNGTPQGGGNPVPAYYISHTAGEGGGTTEPEPPVAGEGDYASDSPFVQATDDSTNAAYGLGDTQIGGQAVTGFKLGKSKQEGKFTSKAIGVSGDKYLNFYAVSWGAGGDKTIYFRVNGGEAIAQPIKANEGAAQNPPYNNIVVAESDHYSVLLSGLSESDVIEFSTNAAFDCATTTDYATRAIFFGVKLTDEALGGTTGGGTTEPEPEPGVVKATVAEFLAAAEDATIYELTGTIKGTYNTLYGNFYLEDATGEVLIYGIVKDGEKCYEALGLKDGDTLTIQGARTSYNGAAQMKNAEYISHTAGQGGGTTEPEPEPGVVKATVAEFLNAAEDATIYELTGTIKGTYNTFYGNFYLEDATGEVLIYGIVKDGEKCYEALGLKDGDTLTIQGARASYNGAAQMKNAEYISHTAGQGGGTTEPEPEPSDVIKATIAEFVAAAESTTQWYELTGKITSIEKADYGNIYIQDETASILIYGLCSTNVEKNDKSFASLGLKVGDTVTLRSLRTSYNGTAQGGGTPPAYYISHESAPVVEPEVPEGSVVASVVFANLGYTNGQSVEGKSIAVDDNVTLVFKQAASGNAPAYYDSGAAIRMYQNGATLDVTANGKTITSIEFTFASNHYYIGADSGELSAEGAVRTWTGSATDVKFTSTGTDKNHRAYVQSIKVTYTE